MSIQWNQWRETALTTPQAGQIQSTADDQVVRAKRPLGSHRLSAERLDEKRSPRDVAANQQSLRDIRASLNHEYGAEVATAVYQQLFQGKESRGRPISSAEILVADGLAQQLVAGQNWLVGQSARFDPDLALRAFAQALAAPIPLVDGKLTTDAVTDRIHLAAELARGFQTQRSVEQSKVRYLELFAATPETQVNAAGEVTRPRQILLQHLREMVDAPLTRPEVQGDGPVRQVEGDSGAPVGLAERQVLLSSLLPTADQLLSLQTVDSQAALFDVTLTEEREAGKALKQAEGDLHGWQELLASTPGKLTQAQSELQKAEQEVHSITEVIAQSQGELAKAQVALNGAETHAAQRGLQEQLLEALEEATQTRVAELGPVNQAYMEASDRHDALQKQVKEFRHRPSGFFNLIERARYDKALLELNTQLTAAKEHLALTEGTWRQKLEEVNLRAAAQAGRRKEIHKKLDELHKDDAAAAQAVSSSRDAVAVAGLNLSKAQAALASKQAEVGARQAEVGQLQADLVKIPEEIQKLEAVLPERREALAKAQEKVAEFKIGARPDLRDLISTRANVLALERERFPTSELSTQELEDVCRFTQLKLAQIPSDANERPALLTVAAIAQDEWLVRLDALQRISHDSSKQAKDQRDAGIRAGDPETRLQLRFQKENAELLSELRPHFKFLRGGTAPSGHHTSHPALRVAVALHQVRVGEATAQEAAKTAMTGGSEENQQGVLGLLEARRQAVIDGTLEPRAFGPEAQDLLKAVRNQAGLGPTLKSNVLQHGANVDVLVNVYRSSQRAIDDWAQARKVQQGDVAELQKPAPKPNPVLAALRTVFSLGRSEASREEAAQRAKAASQGLTEQLQRALQNVQTTEERLLEATVLRDQAKYALQAAADPQNDATLRLWVKEGVLLRDGHLALPDEVNRYLKVMREAIPADILAA